MTNQSLRRRNSISCCKDCTKDIKCIGCHSVCEEYIAECKENEKKRQWRREHNNCVVYKSSFVGTAKSRSNPKHKQY